MKPLSIIVAIAQNHAIGFNNQLLWHISEDLKHFKKITQGHTVIMGKKTWESLPFKPLPHRKNIVLTDIPGEKIENSITLYSIPQVLEVCDELSDNFIIGGGSIYHQFFHLVQKLYITKVYKDFVADTYFPEIDPEIWEIVEQSELQQDTKEGLSYQFVTYQRK